MIQGIQQKLKAIQNYIYVRYSGLTNKPQNLFLVFAAFFGLMFVFVIPPMQSPDEVEHLYRSYQISELNLFADPVGQGYGGNLPSSLVNAAQTFKGTVAGKQDEKFHKSLLVTTGLQSLLPQKKQEVRFDNTAIYSPVPYIPQAIGVGIARIFQAPPLLIIYFGRIANLVFLITLIFLSIRIVPIGKWAFALVVLNPVSLFLVSTLSSDAISIGIVALLIAIVLRLHLKPVRLTRFQIALLFLLIILLCLTKNVYIPLVLMIFIVPNTVLSKKIKIAMFVTGITLGLLWNTAILSVADGIPKYFGMSAHIDRSLQVEGIINQPLAFTSTFLRNIFGQPGSAVIPSYSGVFGWLDTPNPYWISLLYFVILILTLFYRSEPTTIIKKINYKIRLSFLLLFMVCFGAIFLTLYVGYSAVNSSIINGVQGRYFIPLTLLLIPVFVTQLIDIKISRKTFLNVLATSLLVIFVGTLVTLVTRYY